MKKVGYFFSSFLPFIIAVAAPYLAMALMIGVALVFLYVIIPATKGGAGNTGELIALLMNMDFNTCIMLIYSIVCIVFFSLWYYHSCGGNFLPKPSRTFHILEFLGVIVIVPGAQFFCNYLISIISILFPKWLEQYEELLETSGLASDTSLLMLCYAVILGPICEELIFRGATMRQARKAVPFWLANILQALLFGIFHMNWIQGIYAFALGLLLGFVCEIGGSIYYSILLHILFNFSGTVLSSLLEGIEDTMFTRILMLLFTLVSLSVGMILFVFGIKKKEARNRRIASGPVS